MPAGHVADFHALRAKLTRTYGADAFDAFIEHPPAPDSLKGAADEHLWRALAGCVEILGPEHVARLRA
jgi:sugar lactone lactonase YvrE